MSTRFTNQKQTRADNGNDHRAGTSNLNIQKHAQVRLRVHRIVIPRFLLPLRRIEPWVWHLFQQWNRISSVDKINDSVDVPMLYRELFGAIFSRKNRRERDQFFNIPECRHLLVDMDEF